MIPEIVDQVATRRVGKMLAVVSENEHLLGLAQERKRPAHRADRLAPILPGDHHPVADRSPLPHRRDQQHRTPRRHHHVVGVVEDDVVLDVGVRRLLEDEEIGEVRPAANQLFDCPMLLVPFPGTQPGADLVDLPLDRDHMLVLLLLGVLQIGQRGGAADHSGGKVGALLGIDHVEVAVEPRGQIDRQLQSRQVARIIGHVNDDAFGRHNSVFPLADGRLGHGAGTSPPNPSFAPAKNQHRGRTPTRRPRVSITASSMLRITILPMVR